MEVLMERQCLEFLETKKNLRFDIFELEDHVMKALGERYHKLDGYQTFVQIVNRLVDMNKIKPVKARGKTGMTPPLFRFYQIIVETVELTREEQSEIAFGFPEKMNLGYYINHPEKYREHREILMSIKRFLEQPEQNAGWLSMNERSYELFFDEKWLSKYGESFLKRIGMSIADLRCDETPEPFMYYATALRQKLSVSVLIVENKDTFYSLKALFRDRHTVFGGVDFDLLIYGEGNKIEKSFFYYEELENYRGKPAHFYYFGDFDAKGIEIWHGAQSKHNQKIVPFVPFYEALLRLHHEHTRTGDRDVDGTALSEFASYFKEPLKTLLLDLMKRRQQIPQEGLNRNDLRVFERISGTNGIRVDYDAAYPIVQ